jgi:SAM-dependent methyltransferase
MVDGVDLSPELIEISRRSSAEQQPGSVRFAVGDILALPNNRYDGILCRGVLNDVIDDDQRNAVFNVFARVLRPNGVIILDVREWGASAERKAREPLFRKRVSTDLGELTFTSVTELDRENRQLLISERHALVHRGVERVSDYQFIMRCWDRRELSAALARHGFGSIAYFGAYDPHIEAGATDRLVAVAQVSGLVV